jgi:hypothetical protein
VAAAGTEESSSMGKTKLAAGWDNRSSLRTSGENYKR